MIESLLAKVDHVALIREVGRVEKFVGTIIEVSGLHASVGDYCEITSSSNGKRIKAEVVAFRDSRVLLMPFNRVTGISFGDEVVKSAGRADIPVSEKLLGRVVDPFIKPLDGMDSFEKELRAPIYPEPSNPLNKRSIAEQLKTSMTLVDGALPIGVGQRLGIFSGSGVGKSTLFKKLAINIEADVKVIVMIGERGREVNDLVELLREKDCLKDTVVVAASADQPALTRAHALFSGTTIAEYFARQGKSVVLLADSVTRHALAQREVGLAVGEPPALRGFPPSVFAQLPMLVERAGVFKSGGSITAIYTVLVEGDDLDEPVADNMRAILDGHIVLSRELSDQGIYPSIDILKSRSRVMEDIFTSSQKTFAEKIRKTVSDYESIRDFIEIGGYQKGSDALIDEKINAYQKFQKWMTASHGEYLQQVGVF